MALTQSKTTATPNGTRRKTQPPKPGNRGAYAGERTLRNTVVILVAGALLALTAYPIGLAFVGSFHNWNPLNSSFDFIGLQNYQDLFASADFWGAMVRTVLFSAVVIAFRVVLGLALAMALFSKLTKGRTFFRTVFYMPVITPLVAVAYVWKMMFNPQSGALDSLLGLNINWLLDPQYALPSITAMTIWKDFGFGVILYLAALHSIPTDVLEAAAVDGANGWKTFWHVTFPLLAPMTAFVVITSIIGYLQSFIQVLVLTGGGPGSSTQLISFLIYDKAFVKYDFGYASAASFVLLLFTGILTYFSFRIASRNNLQER